MTEPFMDMEDAIIVLIAATFEERSQALQRLLLDAWKHGWDDCDESYKAELALLGVVLQMPPARA